MTDYVATRTGNRVRVKLSTGWTITHTDGERTAHISPPGYRRATGAIRADKRETVERLVAAVVDGLRDMDPNIRGPFNGHEWPDDPEPGFIISDLDEPEDDDEVNNPFRQRFVCERTGQRPFREREHLASPRPAGITGPGPFREREHLDERRAQMSKSMIVAATPKPLAEMMEDEVRAWAKQFHEQLVRQDSQRSHPSSLPLDEREPL